MALGVYATQRNATNNQSTVDFQRDNIFMFQNRFQEAVLVNKGAPAVEMATGMLVVRDTDTAGQVELAAIGTLANVIGITFMNPVTLAQNETSEINYAISGDIDVSLLELPDSVTLDTTVGAKALRDILTDLGFVLQNVTETSKFDN
jgi:hypothetical protein